MGKRPPSKGWNECGFYIERTPDFGSNWGVRGNSVTGGRSVSRRGFVPMRGMEVMARHAPLVSSIHASSPHLQGRLRANIADESRTAGTDIHNLLLHLEWWREWGSFLQRSCKCRQRSQQCHLASVPLPPLNQPL